MTAPAHETPVAIVGGGPTGMGLAIELARRGIACTVIERHASPQPIPKGQNLTQRTMEHFRAWGIERELRAARSIPPEYGIGGMTAYGSLLSGIHYDWLQREVVRPYYFTDNERLPQYETEAVLRARAAQFDAITVLYGWTADGAGQDDDGVTIRMHGKEGAARRTLRAAFAVGCDGSKSVMRAAADITQERTDHDRLMTLLVFRSPQLHELLKPFRGKSFYNVLHPDFGGYWQFFGRVDLGSTFFFHAPVPPDTTAENFDAAAFLHRAAGAVFDVEILHLGFWDLRFAVARSYRRGRIFIGGDAAHSHPPYGGYGINLGFEDVRNLGWKLAAHLQGWGGPGLLDSYDLERRPVFESTSRDFIQRSIAQDRGFLERYDPQRDPAAFNRAWKQRSDATEGEIESYEPHYTGSPLIWGHAGAVGGAVGQHRYKARAGHHLAPATLTDGTPIADAIGDDYTLLAFGVSGRAVASIEAAARARGVPLRTVIEPAGGECARYEARLVLVRPDHFVAWASDDEAFDASRVVDRAVGFGAFMGDRQRLWPSPVQMQG